jgi:hypothetical protein
VYLLLRAATSLAFLFVPEPRRSDTKHEAGERIVMAPKKAPKKGEEQPEGDIISDTIAAGVIHNIKSWATIADKMEGELSYSDDDGENYLRNIANTGLHKAAARPKLVSYTDMVIWELDKVDVPTRSILNEQGEVAGSFRPEHIQVMYKLSPNHKHTLNSEFLAAFQQKECYEGGQSYLDMIKEWVRDKNKFRADAHGIYATASLNDYMRYLVMMLCRLYGKKDSNHFSAEWTPLLEEVSEGNSFNWHKILSDNITTEVTNYQTAREKGQFVAFYMSAYIMDAICFRTPFPLMSWSWNPSCTEPVHIYHSTLWEDHAKDSFYEICHFVIIPLHKIFFGFEPPRISHAIIENLKTVADWFIEEHFSYVRVYGCSIPPHALPKILPDRLICREIAYQLVNGGIRIELKSQQKKSWPYFPVYLGKFALLNFGHSKVEAESLSEIKLVDIEHRKYDPYQIINKHVAQCGLKAYEHEESFYDDVFRNAKSYDEVQSKVQTLSPDAQVGFASFQRNRRQCLPKILQGEISTSEHESESIPPGFETIIQYDASSKDKSKDSEALPQNTEDPQRKEAHTGKGKGIQTNPTDLDDFPKTFGGTASTTLGSPITALTPLQATFGNPHEGALYVSDLEPISKDELPSSDYFFSKKRRAVLKQELHSVGERTLKKHKIIIDGKKLHDSAFATELAGSMGAIASANMYSVENLINTIEQKNQEITQLRGSFKENEKLIAWGIKKGLEQARLKDIQDIQQLNENLTEAKQTIQNTQEQVQTLSNENTLLQDKIISITNQVIELDQFKIKEIEIYANIQQEQQRVFSNMKIIQNYFYESKKSLDVVVLKEIEAKAVRDSFQKVLSALQEKEIRQSQKLSISEQLKGDVMLKVWETKLKEYKGITEEVINDCQRIFGSISKDSIQDETNCLPESLGEININNHQLKIIEGFEEKKMEISNVKAVNISEIEKWMIGPSSILEKIKSTEKEIANQLLGLQRSFFSLEANEVPEVPKSLVNFLERHIQTTEEDRRSFPPQN